MHLLPTLSFVAALAPAPAPAQEVLFHEDFEAGLGNWSVGTLWHLADASSSCLTGHAGATPLPSGTHAAWFGSESTCDFSPVPWHWGLFPALTLLQPIPLPTDAPSLLLDFTTLSEGEGDGVWDTWTVEVRRASDGQVLASRLLLNSGWRRRTLDISNLAGEAVVIRFVTWPGDTGFNEFLGWLVDDVVVRRGATQAQAMCSGDGTLADCPCGNQGGPGRGCANSFQPLGAELTAAGIGSVGADTLVMTATGVANASVTLFQGGNDLPNFFEVSGDGLLCTSGGLLRIASNGASSNTVAFPQPGQLPISLRGLVQPGQAFVYQARYRNAATFCTPATYNFTNGVELRWWP
ncbi:MAG: hypothetical protein IPJ77_00990 [Planctomycetes bacterium]|nr:hypothetical protein [Planctomycetota bacterium]